MSTYIVSREPSKYGGLQEAYVEAVDEIVKNAAEQFRSAVTMNLDLTQFFHETLASFGEARHLIAVNHQTKNADQFGIRRDKEESFPGPFGLTPLCKPYGDYNKSLLPVIQKQLKTMKYNHQGFQETKSEIIFEPCLGRRSAMEFSIITEQMLKNWRNPFTEKEYQRFCKLCTVTPVHEGDIFLKIDQLMKNKDAMQKLKQSSPEDYKCLKLTIFLIRLRSDYPKELKSDWVLVTTRSEVDGKMYALSQYFTWLYRDYKIDPVDNMTNRSIISVTYQDPFLLEAMLNDIAKIFKKAIEWDGKDTRDLLDQMALFRYEHSHAIPFERGSAAVGEWFERAIYLYHGMDIEYVPEKMIDVEALTSPLGEFVSNYNSMFKLTKIKDQ